jgi:uncharacterized OsmC-like protein
MLARIVYSIPWTLLAASCALTMSAAAQDTRTPAMNLIDADQKPAVEKSLRELRAASATEAATTNKAVVTLIGNQHSTASVRGFTIVQDEPASVAGGARGPTPTDYFMVALGSCQNVVLVRYAALEQVAIDSLETTVTGIWDRRGVYGLADIDPGFHQITIETRVSTPAPADKVAELARRTRRGCPIFATLRKETPLTVRLIVNGQQQVL